MEKRLHIVSFDVPYPPNYGGVIDVFHKLRWFHKMGVRVHLHCFVYGREQSEQLESICDKVSYYPRRTGVLANLSPLPYTVRSRRSTKLEENLLADEHPILFEVLHTCFLLGDERFSKRLKIYRHSNIEHEYYRHLAAAEKDAVKRIYLKAEARKLEKFEKVVEKANLIAAVNELDAEYFKKRYPSVRTEYIPSFHSNDKVNIKEGKGDYVLYHGNLSVSENYEAAVWLIDNVFSKLKHPVIIAGLNPPSFIKTKIAEQANIRLIENPSEEKMSQLIADAHLHCLYTAQPTGLKLKLLNVLFSGRFTVCNANMVSGTGFAPNKGLGITEEFVNVINACMEKSFDSELISERNRMLDRFSNERNIRKLMEAIWPAPASSR